MGADPCGSETFTSACRHITNFSTGQAEDGPGFREDAHPLPGFHIEVSSHSLSSLEECAVSDPSQMVVVQLNGGRDVMGSGRDGDLRTLSECAGEPESGSCAAPSDSVASQPISQACGEPTFDGVSVRGLQVVEIDMSRPDSGFRRFWDVIGAQGDLDAALQEMKKHTQVPVDHSQGCNVDLPEPKFASCPPAGPGASSPGMGLMMSAVVPDTIRSAISRLESTLKTELGEDASSFDVNGSVAELLVQVLGAFEAARLKWEADREELKLRLHETELALRELSESLDEWKARSRSQKKSERWLQRVKVRLENQLTDANQRLEIAQEQFRLIANHIDHMEAVTQVRKGYLPRLGAALISPYTSRKYPLRKVKKQLNNTHPSLANWTEPVNPSFTVLGRSDCESLLTNSHDPVLTLNRLVDHGVMRVEDVGFITDRMMRNRDEAFPALVEKFTDINDERAQALVWIHVTDYRGEAVDSSEVKHGYLLLRKSEIRLSSMDYSCLIKLAVKSGDIELVELILDDLGELAGKLPPICKIGILRLVTRRQADYRSWRERLGITPIEEVKIYELDFLNGVLPAMTHGDAIDRLCRVVPPEVSDEITRDIKDCFERRPSQCGWMDCRGNASLRQSLMDSIRQKLADRTPYSLIRLGDGESYAWTGEISAERVRFREMAWWGTTLPSELRHRIASEMFDAIREADVLGVPSIFRIARDIMGSRKSLYEEPSRRELVTVLHGAFELPGEERRFTEERIHQLCFDLEGIEQLIPAARRVVVVSSIKEELIQGALRERLADQPLITIPIPTHARTAGGELFESSDQPLPFVYDQVLDQIRTQVSPGSLVLVAGGSIGKIFCGEARHAGGVALDVGAMADYWLGAKTRSIADMI